MGLLDDLNTPDAFKTLVGTKCYVCKTIASLEPAESVALQRLLNDKQTTGATIARILTKNGIKTNGDNIQRHRRGDCRGTA